MMNGINTDIKEDGVTKLDCDNCTIVVTGFGPFGVHGVNASWETVKELEKIGVKNVDKLVIKEIPVRYEDVKTMIPDLWKKYKPKLVVHCGVSGLAKELTLEQEAHNDQYNAQDITNELPCSGLCVTDGTTKIVAGICMKRVCQSVSEECQEVPVVVSSDAGRFLCEFSYYTSLNINSDRTAFIHVPPLDKPYSVTQLARALKLAIEAMLDQVTTNTLEQSFNDNLNLKTPQEENAINSADNERVFTCNNTLS